MLGKLKVECGAAFTRDLEGMLKDMKMSAEMARNFKDSMQRPNQPVSARRFWTHVPGLTPDPTHLQAHLRPSMDLTVTVGSSSMWPMSQNKPPCAFPPEFQAAMKAYERFYGNRHSGRKLTWRAELGNVDMRVQFRKSAHELNVSTLAAVVLLLFRDLDEGERLTLEVRHCCLFGILRQVELGSRTSKRPRLCRMRTYDGRFNRWRAQSSRCSSSCPKAATSSTATASCSTTGFRRPSRASRS